MSFDVFDKNGNKKIIAETNDLPKLLYSGKKSIDGNLLNVSGINDYKLLFIDFIHEGNWYFSTFVFNKINSHVVEIPTIGKEFYVHTYEDGIKLVNARGYDLSKIYMTSIYAI